MRPNGKRTLPCRNCGRITDRLNGVTCESCGHERNGQ